MIWAPLDPAEQKRLQLEYMQSWLDLHAVKCGTPFEEWPHKGPCRHPLTGVLLNRPANHVQQLIEHCRAARHNLGHEVT